MPCPIRIEAGRGAAALAAALAAGCAGGGAQGNVMMPAGSGFGGSGNTVVRIYVPPAVPSSGLGRQGLGPAPSSGGGGVPLPGGTLPPGPTSPPGGALPPGATPPSAAPPSAAPTATPGNNEGFPAPPASNGSATQALPGGAQVLPINVNGPTSFSQAVPVGPNAGGCAPSPLGGSTCQLMLSLPAGTYTGTVGNTAVAFSVAANANNALNLTLGGVPSQLSVVPANSLSAINQQGGIDLYGAGKHLLLVEMLDANQNVMVGGGATYSLSQAGGALSVGVAQVAGGAPNLFSVTAGVPGASSAILRAGAQYGGALNPCLQPNAVCNGNARVDVRQVLAVADSNANSVTLYVSGQNSPLTTIQNALNDPQALIFDAAGDLFIANQAGSVTVYPPPYVQPAVTITEAINHPQALALDAHGNLFVANGNGSNTVTVYSPPYGGGPSATVSANVDDPVGLAVDANADLFVVNAAANTITAYVPPYADPPTTISKGLNAPSSLAIDSHGNLFVANLNSTPNSIVEYAPPFSAASAPIATITNGVNEQGSITVASANLFVPNQGANTVTEYAAPYTNPPTTIVGGESQPIALAVDVFGQLYVANYGNNTVTEYTPPYAPGAWTTISIGVSAPMALALSPATPGGPAILP